MIQDVSVNDRKRMKCLLFVFFSNKRKFLAYQLSSMLWRGLVVLEWPSHYHAASLLSSEHCTLSKTKYSHCYWKTYKNKQLVVYCFMTSSALHGFITAWKAYHHYCYHFIILSQFSCKTWRNCRILQTCVDGTLNVPLSESYLHANTVEMADDSKLFCSYFSRRWYTSIKWIVMK